MKINAGGYFLVQTWQGTPLSEMTMVSHSYSMENLAPLHDTHIAQSSDLSRGCPFGSEVTELQFCFVSTPCVKKKM